MAGLKKRPIHRRAVAEQGDVKALSALAGVG
jgi:hypothetical protein